MEGQEGLCWMWAGGEPHTRYRGLVGPHQRERALVERARGGCGQGRSHTRGTGAWWVDECDDGGSCRVEGHVHGVNLAQECEDICARIWAWLITQKWPVVGFITSSPQPHTRSHQRVYQLAAAYAGRLSAPMALSTIAAYSARHQLDA